MANDKRSTTLRLSDESYEKLRYLAYKGRNSINKQIELAIAAYIVAYEETHGSIPVEPEE